MISKLSDSSEISWVHWINLDQKQPCACLGSKGCYTGFIKQENSYKLKTEKLKVSIKSWNLVLLIF